MTFRPLPRTAELPIFPEKRQRARYLLWILVLVLPLVTAGCELFGSENDEEPATTGVFVANQGNFGDGNGSISIYDPATQTTSPAAISNLGTIIQSLALHDDRLYVMSNTGERVDVFTLGANTQVAQIVDVTSPRYMAVVNDTKAYVTNLYADSESFSGGKVTVINPSSNMKGAEIEIGGNPEGAVVVGDRLYVATGGFAATTSVVAIDVTTDEVIEEIDVECDGPRSLAADADAEVFVFCTGRTIYDDDFNPIGETDGALRILEGATGEITERIPVDGRISTSGPGQDAHHAPDAREIYVVKDANTILRFDTVTNEQVGQIGPLDGAPIGAVAYDALSQQLYVAHVPSFTESGTVTIHDRAGTQVGQFTVGIAPSFIAFRREVQ